MRIIIFLSLFIFSSCSAIHYVNKSEKFKAKAISKGAKYETKIKIVRLTDTLTINGKDSIVERFVNIECPEVEVKTRWMVRFDNNRFKDSLNIIKRMYSDSLDSTVKIAENKGKIDKQKNKQDNKTERTTTRQENKNHWFMWLSIGFVLCMALFLAIKLLVPYLKTSLLK